MKTFAKWTGRAIVVIYFGGILFFLIKLFSDKGAARDFWVDLTAYWVAFAGIATALGWKHLHAYAQSTAAQDAEKKRKKRKPNYSNKTYEWLARSLLIVYFGGIVFCFVKLFTDKEQKTLWVYLTSSWAGFAGLAVALGWKHLHLQALKGEETRATLTAKYVSTITVYQPNLSFPFQTEEVSVMIFQTPEKTELKFESMELRSPLTEQFPMLRVGDTGTLIYKQRKNDMYFIAFRRDGI